MRQREWWDDEVWGNSIYSYGVAVAIIAISFVAIRIFKYFVLKRLKSWSLRTRSSWDDVVIMGIERFIVPLLYISAVYFAFTTLKVPAKAAKIGHIAYLVVFTFYMLRLVSAAIRRMLTSFARKRGDGEFAEEQAGGLMILVNIVIWMVAIIFLIDNLGYSVTTLITGLGIGGIAIALAAQTILGDLFSYFVIFFDRPFEIGDSITVGTQSGTVEKVGIKTTRIRTLSGDQLVCSNTDLTNSRVNNFKRMENRRVAFTIGVIYDTPEDVVKEIPSLVKDIIDRQEHVEFGRGHFFQFGPSSLDFEFVYNVMDPDYGLYMDVQQAIYLEILRVFNSRGIQFAYPTQTIFVSGTREEEKALTS
jgi:small-conductance mechanosensitive channel